jgi:hypothetical protein
MRELLRRRLALALAPDGWIPATPTRESSFYLAELVRPLDDDMAATASVGRASSIPDHLPVWITDVHVGVCYEPLRRLWPLLGDDYRLALIHDQVFPDQSVEDEDEVEDRRLKVSSAAEAEVAVDAIGGVILREAVPFAERYAGIEPLLDEFGFDEEQGFVDQRAVAVLAAARRFEDANAALARYRPTTGSRERDREARRFVHQVRRYIDSRGDPSIVPREPPPSRYGTSERPSMSEVWRQVRARGEAVKLVKAMSADTDRAELRAALESELAARGLSESPLWYEQTLDHLHDTPVEQAQTLAKGVRAAAGVGFRVVRAMREHRPPPDLSAPAWLDPPDRAAYRVPQKPQGQWIEVELDEPAGPVLERAYAEIPRLVGSTATAEAWLDWERESREQLVVSLGSERVGTLAPDAAAAYRAVMTAAEERDELPSISTRLTPRPERGGYLVEVQLPD